MAHSASMRVALINDWGMMKTIRLFEKAQLQKVAAVALLGLASLAHAQTPTPNSIFPAGWDNTTRQRMFMNFGYITLLTKSESSEARDVTGPVLTRQQLIDALQDGAAIHDPDDPHYGGFAYQLGYSALFSGSPTTFDQMGLNGLGTPAGIHAKAGNAGTPVVSFGYWFDESFLWNVEAFLLGMPMTVKAYGEGTNASGNPNGLADKELLTTKLLPPLAWGLLLD